LTEPLSARTLLDLELVTTILFWLLAIDQPHHAAVALALPSLKFAQRAVGT
jgi:hypothetical protein